ncbi:MAG: transposase [Chloroflexi bacterium]|uniref:Transposase n=1 Tax=Candidatus Chlorohelix allophototropha TaxID=3003348 RepID=A0A8T7M562_9CHLR|nr:transposase [Chloroflexota bacterium]WJW69115.1 transposase [Chloroflexota bacterium L227-S17]
MEIHQEQLLKVKPENLPGDAVFKGYRYVVVRDLVFQPLNIRFKKERYYSPAQKRMIEAELRQGYQGQFSPTAKALVLALYYEGLMSEPKIKELLWQAGLNISAGQLSHWLTDPTYQAQFHTESRQVLSAGLGSSKWQHIDTTSSRVAGVNWHCPIICNPLYTYYCTLTNKDRLSAIRALRGGAGKEALIIRMDKNAEAVGSLMGLTKALVDKLWELPLDQDLCEQTVNEFLAREFSQQPNYKWKRVKDALAIASYHAQVGEDLPILKILICDDAPSFQVITEEVALCWVHDGRHYKKLEPRLAYHRALLEEFRGRYWRYYRELLAYQQNPGLSEAARLDTAFNELFATHSGYKALDERIAITQAKKWGLLMVLKHPEIPLHNNPAELAVRTRVRKRDVSMFCSKLEGVRSWDTFQGLASTCRKLGINFYEYLLDRISQNGKIVGLGTLIKEKAAGLNLNGSWINDKPRPEWQPLQLRPWLR